MSESNLSGRTPGSCHARLPARKRSIRRSRRCTTVRRRSGSTGLSWTSGRQTTVSGLEVPHFFADLFVTLWFRYDPTGDSGGSGFGIIINGYVLARKGRVYFFLLISLFPCAGPFSSNSPEWRGEHLGRIPSWCHRKTGRRDRDFTKQIERVNHDVPCHSSARHHITGPTAYCKIRRSTSYLSFISPFSPLPILVSWWMW